MYVSYFFCGRCRRFFFLTLVSWALCCVGEGAVGCDRDEGEKREREGEGERGREREGEREREREREREGERAVSYTHVTLATKREG